MSDRTADLDSVRTPVAYAVFAIVTGALGWWAAFNLMVDKIQVLEHPTQGFGALSCNINVFFQCSRNLNSAQGSLLGFPNPILGLAGFVAPMAVGVALLAGARCARWFWIAFNLGLAVAFAFVVFLVITSIYFLGTLCPWCMLVWLVTIPLFIWTTARNVAVGVWSTSARARRVGDVSLRFVFPAAVACYLVIAVLAQLRLPVIQSLLPH